MARCWRSAWSCSRSGSSLPAATRQHRSRTPQPSRRPTSRPIGDPPARCRTGRKRSASCAMTCRTTRRSSGSDTSSRSAAQSFSTRTSGTSSGTVRARWTAGGRLLRSANSTRNARATGPTGSSISTRTGSFTATAWCSWTELDHVPQQG
ncbi:MAG: hypothetical protein AMS20_00175 [Gemmatimonas sp. SG8_28]|nr:MAG: hypothetical protein AMS20_00175 [Gemmatimonas sp. SG8_28]